MTNFDQPPPHIDPHHLQLQNLGTKPEKRMSLHSASRAKGFDEEENDRHDRLEIQEEARSPALSIQDEEDEADDGDDHRALLSSTIVRRGENSSPHHQNERSKLRNASHVSNWRFMKDIFVETMPTLMFALLGTFLTGELLELLATWQAFKNINELLILVPMLLNLKGNLEMNLSARLSTASNMGDLDTREVRRSLISGNLSLLQVQALLVSCLAAAVSSLIGMILPSENETPKTPASGTMASLAEGALRLAIRAHPHRPPSTLPTPANSGPREFMIILLVAQTAASLSSIILGAF
ncbi:16708_t:CDS:2, partial [Acaulospora colombiana]